LCRITPAFPHKDETLISSVVMARTIMGNWWVTLEKLISIWKLRNACGQSQACTEIIVFFSFNI